MNPVFSRMRAEGEDYLVKLMEHILSNLYNPVAKADVSPTPESRVAEQLFQLAAQWPSYYDCIDLERISPDQCSFITNAASKAPDFASLSSGGRGELYRSAQQDPLVRATGIRKLFKLVSPDHELSNLSPKHRILDVLGGDGVLARAMYHLVPSTALPDILTSDLSEDMVAAARAYGLLALQQPAQGLLLKDNTLDGIIIAYGTHHIPRDQQPKACREAFRVLKPKGKVVLHDFEVGSAMSSWFSDVVDRYSLTGHAFPHFMAGEIQGLLENAGFENVRVEHLYDPFIVSGTSPQDASRQLAKYLLNMYGLTKLVDELGYDRALDKVESLASAYFRIDYANIGLNRVNGESCVRVFERKNRWYVEAPRLALVGYGTKL